MALNLPKCRLRHVHSEWCFPLELPKLTCRIRHVHNNSCFEDHVDEYSVNDVTDDDPSLTMTVSLNKSDVPSCGRRRHRHTASCFEQDSFSFDLPAVPDCYNFKLSMEKLVTTRNPMYMFTVTMFVNNYPS